MTDLTPILNELLKSQNSLPTLDPSLALQKIDEFLKEAYRIVSPRLAGKQTRPAKTVERMRI